VALFPGLPASERRAILWHFQSGIGKEGRVLTTFFVHYRTRGPIQALQMRLQG
jgi:hypothetical protein